MKEEKKTNQEKAVKCGDDSGHVEIFYRREDETLDIGSVKA